jgi:hypothetical protein
MLTSTSVFASTAGEAAATFASEWGQLLGVAAGVILGGIAQIVASVVQRRDEESRENRTTKRAAYTEFLQVLDDLEFAMMRLERAFEDKTAKQEDLDKFFTTLHGFNAALVAVQVNGSRSARDIAEEIRKEIGSHGFARANGSELHDLIAAVHEFEMRLISEIRKDLGVRE